jgi:hypothetical protein
MSLDVRIREDSTRGWWLVETQSSSRQPWRVVARVLGKERAKVCRNAFWLEWN